MNGIATMIQKGHMLPSCSVSLTVPLGQPLLLPVPELLPHLEPEDLNQRGTQMNLEEEDSGMCREHEKPWRRMGCGLGREARFLRRGGL